MTRRTIIRGLPFLFALLLFDPSRAQAIPVLITSGDSFIYVGEVTDELKAVVRKETKVDAAVGYKYSHFGIFWLALWTWGGEYCLYKDNQYWKLTPAQAAVFLKKPESELSVPFWYRFPPGLLIVIGIVVLSSVAAVIRKRPEKKLKKLLGDVRYQKALEIYSGQLEKETAAAQEKATAAAEQGGQPNAEAPEDPGRFERAYEAAIQHLTGEGVPRQEAEQNFTLVLNAVAQAQAEGGQVPAS
jgi:hypothetical protein